MTPRRIIVVGGGPAGLMAAGQAASLEAHTLLLEKMDRAARKLRITGKGRCNLTNVAPVSEFIAHFGTTGPFLRQAFARYFSSDLISFMHGLGVRTVTERGGRVFPAGETADELVDALLRWMIDAGVILNTLSTVKRLIVDGKRISGVEASFTASRRDALCAPDVDGARSCDAAAVILTTGGASFPGTGSTGDGYQLAASVGHTIVPLRPALVPLETAGDVSARLQNLKLRNVKVHVWSGGKKAAEAFGEMHFTRTGVSGPIILSLSRKIVDDLRNRRQVNLSIDLKPALDPAKLDARLLRDLDAHGKRRYTTLLEGLLPRQLIPVCVKQTNISPEKSAHQITAAERNRLCTWLKSFRLDVTGHRPISEAIITAGGIDTREVDPRTMASRLVDGLYFAGEVLDVDADTGGYNLQAAFSTGWLAGRSAARHIGQ